MDDEELAAAAVRQRVLRCDQIAARRAAGEAAVLVLGADELRGWWRRWPSAEAEQQRPVRVGGPWAPRDQENGEQCGRKEEDERRRQTVPFSAETLDHIWRASMPRPLKLQSLLRLHLIPVQAGGGECFLLMRNLGQHPRSSAIS